VLALENRVLDANEMRDRSQTFLFISCSFAPRFPSSSDVSFKNFSSFFLSRVKKKRFNTVRANRQKVLHKHTHLGGGKEAHDLKKKKNVERVSSSDASNLSQEDDGENDVVNYRCVYSS